MTSYPCNKYEQITPSYLLSVKYMNLPKFPHSAMFLGVTACGKTEFLLRLLETIYKNHFEFIVILCPTISDNKTYLSRKWIFDDKNVFIVCDAEGKLNEWIKLFKGTLKGHQTLSLMIAQQKLK